MINNKSKSKIKFLAILVAILMVFSSFCLAIIGIKSMGENVFAVQNNVAITNANFANNTITSGSSLPMSPSGWSLKNDNANITAGVITLDEDIATETVVSDKYKLSNLIATYLGMSDNQVLMINAEENSSNCYYESSSVTLSANGYYVVEFFAYTTEDAFGSIRLNGNDELKQNALNINTNATWQRYRLYIETNSLDSISSNIELWIGNATSKSQGAVFFDDINVTSLDNKTFKTLLDKETSNYKYINLYDNEISNFLKNSDFETELGNDNWTIIENSMTGSNNTINGIVNVENFSNDDTKVIDEIKNTNIYGNKNALLINNLTSGFVGYKSAYFTIERNKLYKLSFLVKTGITNGSAIVKLIERNPYTNKFLSDGTNNPYYYDNSSYVAKDFTISAITSKDYSNEMTNDWKTYSFYIKGNFYVNTEVNLELLLGSETSGATGYVLFDHFTLEQLTTSEYQNNNSNGTVANLNQYTTETTIKNAGFNNIVIDNINNTAPFGVENWTLTKSNTNGSVLNGIINTSDDYSTLGIPQIKPINNNQTNNNILMIGNITPNNQKYKSETFTINENVFAKITITVLTTDLVDSLAGVRIVENGNVVAEKLNINTNGEWATITFLIKTGFYSRNLAVELSLGENKNGTGFAFFDNVLYSTIKEEKYNEDNDFVKIDLSKYDWTSIPENSGNTNGVYAPYDWTANNPNNAESITSGVIDTSKYGTENGYNESSLENPNFPENQNSNVLMIKSGTDVYYYYKTNQKISISSGNYYKIETWIKTNNLSQEKVNLIYPKNSTTAYPYGASINIDGIEASFVGIDTKNEWKKYTIYINCTKNSDIAIELGLGSENALTSGVAYYSTTSIEKIEENDYTNGIKVLESNNEIDNILAIGNTDTKKEEDNKTETNTFEFNWLVVPSLVFGIAIVFAVVMFIVRYTKKSGHKKAKIQKEYSAENMKKLATTHKNNLNAISKQKRELTKKQYSIADEINLENAKADEKNVDKIEKLQNEYDAITKKLDNLTEKRNQEIKRYKEKLDELKAIKKADESQKNK